jgi:hypothetical protein
MSMAAFCTHHVEMILDIVRKRHSFHAGRHKERERYEKEGQYTWDAVGVHRKYEHLGKRGEQKFTRLNELSSSLSLTRANRVGLRQKRRRRRAITTSLLVF